MKYLGYRGKGLGYRAAKALRAFAAYCRSAAKPRRGLHPSPFTLHPQRGYSLVEVLVAITVLLVALVGPLTIAHSGLKRSIQSKDNTQAVFLAQEGIEAIVKLREDAALNATAYTNLGQVWSNVFNTGTGIGGTRCPVGGSSYCGVTVNNDGSVVVGSVYQCSGTNCLMKYDSAARVPYKQGASVAGTNTTFTRQIQMTTTGNTLVRVRSIVSWTGSSPGNVTLESYVYNIYYEGT